MTVVVTHSTPADSSFSTTGATAWDANHTLSGVGTMAGQDANNVAITGGAIDGTTVGATTSTTGAFTTLSASSTVSGTGFSTYLASPPAIGGTAASTGRFTTVTSTIATGTAPFTVASTTAVANLSIGGNAGTVTNGVYTTDTGTVTNTMLAGSITNAKLVNSSITFGSTAQALGSTVSGINGVTIDNGIIGGTTAAAGTFTTLTATGQTSLGGAAGAESFRVVTRASATDYVEADGGTSGTSGVYLSAQGASTNINLFLSAKTGAVRFYTGGKGSLEQFRVSNTASAVNYVQVTGAATAGSPVISSQGSDGNIRLTLRSKGTNSIFLENANGVAIFQAAPIASGTAANYLQVTQTAAGSAPIFASAGTDADIDITLTPKGAGRVNITTSIKPKVNSTTSVTSPLAWNSTSYDEYALTALANALTISADANTAPADGQRMMFRFKDNGTARALTWTTGATNAFRVVGVTLPTTTVASKLLYVGCIYNAADSRWDAIAVGQEA